MGTITVVTLNRTRAGPTMTNSIASDAQNRETNLEASAEVCYMSETLAMETTARVG